jgi:hypothetical protein
MTILSANVASAFEHDRYVSYPAYNSHPFNITPYDFDDVVKKAIERGYAIRSQTELINCVNQTGEIDYNTDSRCAGQVWEILPIFIYINTENETDFNVYSMKRMSISNYSDVREFRGLEMEDDDFDYQFSGTYESGWTITIVKRDLFLNIDTATSRLLEELHALGIQEAGGPVTYAEPIWVGVATESINGGSPVAIVMQTILMAFAVMAALAASIFILKMRRKKK